MTKNELKDKIKALVKQVYQKDTPVNLDSNVTIDLDVEAFPVLGKFPDLKQIIIDLFTKQYELFISDIQWVAPKPTTFRILLANGESFLLHYTPRSWVATIEGKKYYLASLGEEEQAVQTLARILSYGQKEEPTEADTETGTEEPAAEEPAAEEPEVEEVPAEA